MVLPFNPPLLNSSNRWATTRKDLEALYNCPDTGAVTIRTSLLSGFSHDDKIHQHCFFGTNSMREDLTTEPPSSTEASSVSSLNTLGYSPVPLQDYISLMNDIENDALEQGAKPKHVIFSVTGTVDEVIKCYASLKETCHASLSTYMEINLSCPNIPNKPPPAYSKDELNKYLEAFQQPSILGSDFIVGIKTPPYTYQGQFNDLIQALLDSCADGKECPVSFISATNTLGSCLVLDGDQPMISSASGAGIGGLAGTALHPLALGNVKTLRIMLDSHPELQSIDIIGVGGVSDADGYHRMRSVGAAAVGIGTAFGHEGISVFEKINSQRRDKQ